MAQVGDAADRRAADVPLGHRVLPGGRPHPLLEGIRYGPGRGQGRELWSVGVDGSDARLVVAGTKVGEWFVPPVASDSITADPALEP